MTSYDCLAFIKFDSDSSLVLRTGTVVATTAKARSITSSSPGGGLGFADMTIDGGQQSSRYLYQSKAKPTWAPPTSIAVGSSTSGTASPLHCRSDQQPDHGQACQRQRLNHWRRPFTVVLPSTFVGTPVQGLSNPPGVALDAAGNVYISDTGNKRRAGVQLQSPLRQPCWATTFGARRGLRWRYHIPSNQRELRIHGLHLEYARIGTKQSIVNEPGAAVTPTVAPPQYAVGKPLGLTVDAWGNVYVADAGNDRQPSDPPAS